MKPPGYDKRGTGDREPRYRACRYILEEVFALRFFPRAGPVTRGARSLALLSRASLTAAAQAAETWGRREIPKEAQIVPSVTVHARASQRRLVEVAVACCAFITLAGFLAVRGAHVAPLAATTAAVLAVAGAATATMLYGRLLVEPELPYAVLCAAYVAVALVAAPGIVVAQHALPSQWAELLVFALGMASFGALGRWSQSFSVDLANRRATTTIVGFGLGLAGVGVGSAVLLQHAHPALFWIVAIGLHAIALALCWRRLLSVFELSVCAAVAFSLFETFAAFASGQPHYPLAPVAVLVDAIALSAAVLGGLLVETNAMYARLRTMAALDDLTGLPNRRMFDDRLDFALAHGERVHVSVAILVIDVDHFKKYNDRYGHLAGDAALRATSTAIAACVKRAGDTVARFGGEEFVVLLTGMSQSSAVGKAERIRHAVEEAAIPHEDSPSGTITVSVGLAYCARPHHEDQRAIFEAADEALYAAKRNGRNRVEVQHYNRVDAYVRHLQQGPESETIIG